MPTPNPRPRRLIKPYQRRALVLLAGFGDAGCSEAIMLTHGFTVGQLAELIRLGLIAAEHVVGGGQTSNGKLKITEAGQRALSGRR